MLVLKTGPNASVYNIPSGRKHFFRCINRIFVLLMLLLNCTFLIVNCVLANMYVHFIHSTVTQYLDVQCLLYTYLYQEVSICFSSFGEKNYSLWSNLDEIFVRTRID